MTSTNAKKMINCYTCGSWVKPDKQGIYKCPKCKAKYIIQNGEIFKYYETFEEFVDD